DDVLRGQAPMVEQRERDEQDHVHTRRMVATLSTELGNNRSGFGGELIEHDMRPFGRNADRLDRRDRRDRHGMRAIGGGAGMRTLADPRRADERATIYGEDDDEDAEEMEADMEADMEAVEPTGTAGALGRAPLVAPPTRKRRPVRIYPFGISRERLEESARQLKVPVEISRDQSDADAVIALKTFYRRQSSQLRDAESERKPIYILRTNTVAQMLECLARIFELRQSEAAFVGGGSRNPTMQAMEEAEQAIHHMLNSGTGQVELEPQNAYVRRLQHQVAGRYNLESRSRGKEPNRRVQIYGR
ncbi:MAG: R3H domain-containing nucleic acid-binding protein, partial [Ktedonobacterales bacterium]